MVCAVDNESKPVKIAATSKFARSHHLKFNQPNKDDLPGGGLSPVSIHCRSGIAKLAPRMINHPDEVVADDEASIYGV
jgi:hypothetical protein